MVGAGAARGVLRAVSAAAGRGAVLPPRDPGGSARPAAGVSAVFCAAMCAALTAMTGRSEPAAATRPQAALFGCAALVHFGQEWFEQAAATSGSPADPELLAARGEARRLACPALDSALSSHQLDA